MTIVKDYVALCRQRSEEMFVPLAHQPGHAQADFGEAIGIIGGVERKIHFLAFDLPHSDACFVVAYPAETTEAFCDGHACKRRSKNPSLEAAEWLGCAGVKIRQPRSLCLIRVRARDERRGTLREGTTCGSN